MKKKLLALFSLLFVTFLMGTFARNAYASSPEQTISVVKIKSLSPARLRCSSE